MTAENGAQPFQQLEWSRPKGYTRGVATTVTDNKDLHRFEIRLDGELAGFTDYHQNGDVMVLIHTEVDERFQGHGLATELVRSPLDDVRARGFAVRPCARWYASTSRTTPNTRTSCGKRIEPSSASDHVDTGPGCWRGGGEAQGGVNVGRGGSATRPAGGRGAPPGGGGWARGRRSPFLLKIEEHREGRRALFSLFVAAGVIRFRRPAETKGKRSWAGPGRQGRAGVRRE